MGWLAAAALLLAVVVAPFVYLNWYSAWVRRETEGMAYYSRPLAARQRLKEQMRSRSRPILSFVTFLSRGSAASRKMPAFVYEGVAGPPGVSSPEVFARAQHYSPTAQDVFVATQMRCGTTWMQQVVFEILMRGKGDLSDNGFGPIYAVSPWIDATTAVSMETAPLVGQPASRIIKTHLPASLCPYGPAAKYIYVTRHPVSCFASITDYHASLLGPLAPPIQAQADWFCSDQMYWRPWPDHVDGWWQWAEQRPNVLFVHYEDMVRNFDAVRDRVAAFLGVTLTPAEQALVTDKTSFKYMKAHEDFFEMAPPTMFSVNGGEYLKSGKVSRHDDVSPAIRQQVLDYCRRALSGRSYPVAEFYEDLGSEATAPSSRVR